jgi:hypothetical protein
MPVLLKPRPAVRNLQFQLLPLPNPQWPIKRATLSAIRNPQFL